MIQNFDAEGIFVLLPDEKEERRLNRRLNIPLFLFENSQIVKHMRKKRINVGQ